MRIVSYLLGLAMIALWVWLLFLGRITQWSFVALLALTPLLIILLHNVENVASITAKFKGNELLLEMHQIRTEIYAKAESVRAMGEGIAEVLAFNLSTRGRFPDEEDLDAELMEWKNRLTTMLLKIGTSQVHIKQICSPIDHAVALDLANRVRQEVFERLPTEPTREEISRKVLRLILDSNGAAANSVRSVLEQWDLWDESVQSKISDFEQFRKTGILAKPSRS